MSKNKYEQISFFDDAVEEIQKEYDKSKTDCICYGDRECSHCKKDDKKSLSQHHILGRHNVFACKYAKQDKQEAEKLRVDFAIICEITGNRWLPGTWSMYRDYFKNPSLTPCDFCDLASCENCLFNKKDGSEGCCSSCGFRFTCVESKSKNKSAGSFINLYISSQNRKAEPLFNSKYNSTCPLFEGFEEINTFAFGAVYCKGMGEKLLQRDVWYFACKEHHDVCPIFKERNIHNEP